MIPARLPRPIEFTVHGVPAPKGAMRAFPVRKAGALTGKVAVTARGSAKQTEWHHRVHEAIRANVGDMALIDGPVTVTLDFRLPRPKSHPKTRRTWPAVAPDIDKLARLVLDALTGTVLVDDARVIGLQASKDYAVDHHIRPGVDVKVWPVIDG